MQFVYIFFHICWISPENLNWKFKFSISRGIVATCSNMSKLRWVMSGFVANFIRFPAVKKFRKSVKLWQSYREFKGGNFFETQCMPRVPGGDVLLKPIVSCGLNWLTVVMEHFSNILYTTQTMHCISCFLSHPLQFTIFVPDATTEHYRASKCVYIVTISL